MPSPTAEPVTIAVGDAHRVSGLFLLPSVPTACIVLAHGAGAGMKHPFMAAVSADLLPLNIATLRYQFPYMERRSKRVDPPALCHSTVRAAVAEAARLAPGLPLYAAGKSFGGRMASQAQAASPLPGVRGLVFFGFPLHPPGKPSDERGKHLLEVQIPMLFLQGTKDEFAAQHLLQPLVGSLGSRATLRIFAEADHSFHVPARSGRKDADVRSELLRETVAWIESVNGSSSTR